MWVFFLFPWTIQNHKIWLNSYLILIAIKNKIPVCLISIVYLLLLQMLYLKWIHVFEKTTLAFFFYLLSDYHPVHSKVLMKWICLPEEFKPEFSSKGSYCIGQHDFRSLCHKKISQSNKVQLPYSINKCICLVQTFWSSDRLLFSYLKQSKC